MKKQLVAASLIILLAIFAGIASVGAATGSEPYKYAEYGQQTLYVASGGIAPVIDGEVADGEYYNTLVFDRNTPGVSFSSETFPAYPSDVKVHMTVDDQYIYLGIVVPEPYYKYRGSTAGSHIAFSLGFNRGETFYQSMDRQTFVFQIYEDKTPFYANTILIYNSTGTYTTSYNAVVFEAVAFLRDDTKGVTVYEAKVKKSEVAAIAGVDKLPKTCYIHFLNKSYDAAGNSAEFRYRCVLDDMARSIITAYDGWCATFAPHLLTFLEPGELPETVETTTPAETTTAAPETTTPAPETTTAAPQTTTVAPETTTAAPETTTAAPGTTTAADTTSSGKSTGCKSAAAFAALPLVLAVPVMLVKKRKD